MRKFKSGVLVEKCRYHAGKLDGNYKHYNPDGTPLYECNYINGVLNGEYKHWVRGKISRHLNYKNGILHGVARIYDVDTGDVTIKLYRKGCDDGLFQTFDVNGVQRRHGMLRNGKPFGLVTEWSESGIVTTREYNSDGEEVGVWYN
jgi:antitoxin component YwqK of YwqJK toxin-antitoxin module